MVVEAECNGRNVRRGGKEEQKCVAGREVREKEDEQQEEKETWEDWVNRSALAGETVRLRE